jgi:putative membrane protein
MYWHDSGTGGWGFLWMLFNGLVLWALLVTGVLLLWRCVRERSTSSDTAERLLAERFARGEINDEEYRRRRELLRHA